MNSINKSTICSWVNEIKTTTTSNLRRENASDILKLFFKSMLHTQSHSTHTWKTVGCLVLINCLLASLIDKWDRFFHFFFLHLLLLFIIHEWIASLLGASIVIKFTILPPHSPQSHAFICIASGFLYTFYYCMLHSSINILTFSRFPFCLWRGIVWTIDHQCYSDIVTGHSVSYLFFAIA